VPFLVSEFDLEKALRWREPLAAALRRSDLVGAFDAAERVRTNWADASAPVGAFADEPLLWIDAELYVRIEMPRPKDTDSGGFDPVAWAPYANLLTRAPDEEWKLWLGGIIVVVAVAVVVVLFMLPRGASGQMRQVTTETASHVDEGAPLSYSHKPPSSGMHYGTLPQPQEYRMWDTPLTPGRWVHMLEHGAVAVLPRRGVAGHHRELIEVGR